MIPVTETGDFSFHSMPDSQNSNDSSSSATSHDTRKSPPSSNMPNDCASVNSNAALPLPNNSTWATAPVMTYSASTQPLLDSSNGMGFGQLPLTARPSRAFTDPQANAAIAQQVDLSRAKLKATSRTSALLAGFAMVALVELDYHAGEDVPKLLMIVFAVVTTLLVSVHLLALMMSTCILPHMEANANLADSPHIRLRWYIELSWFFSTCLGLLLFLLEIAVVFWIKFIGAGYIEAAYVTTAMLIPVVVIFMLFSYNFYKKLMHHQVERLDHKLGDLQKMWGDWQPNSVATQDANKQLQGVTIM